MLVLTRRPNESIKIGDDIEVSVLAIEGDQIKIGIDAPKSVDIHRKEVYIAIQKENNEAADIPEDFLQLLKNNRLK